MVCNRRRIRTDFEKDRFNSDVLHEGNMDHQLLESLNTWHRKGSVKYSPGHLRWTRQTSLHPLYSPKV